MKVAEEALQLNDCFLVNLDIENCPMAEIPLVDMFDMVTSTLLDNYSEILHDTVVQMLEDTTWVNKSTMSVLLNAGFGTFHVRDGGVVISLRKPALQRLITHSIATRATPIVTMQIPIMIRFLLSDVDLPRAPKAPVDAIDAESRRSANRSVPTSSASEAELLDQVSELPGASPVLQTTGTPVPEVDIPGATFRGIPIDTRPVGPGPPATTMRREYVSPHEFNDNSIGGGGVPTQPRRGPLFDHSVGRTPLGRTPTRSHPYSAEVTFGAETFEDYMSQFMYSEVRFKDFRKAVIPKFDSSKNESFVHWYKLLCSTCLQWGIWCPPYESAQEDNVHGAWWKLLPMSVRNNESFMAHLIYSILIRETTFPLSSREHDAVEGCPPNAGYNAIYALLRMHHPLLHSVLSTANEIPRHRRTEAFSQYLRRLQEFIARERLATRTYTESEALDLAVRNLTIEWRNEFRRLVERDKRSGPSSTLPFKLALPQLATTFVEYATEIGREPPGSGHAATTSRHTPTSIIRRLETTDDDVVESAFLADADVDLIVRAIAHNQEASAVCLGCQLPGHTLVECNRFVDYIVAESLAQRHPALRTQIANSHNHFRSRLNAATAHSRSTSGTANKNTRAMRSLQMALPPSESPNDLEAASTPAVSAPIASDDDSTEDDYRQHAIHIVNDELEDTFESCFASVTIHSVELLGINDSCPISVETVLLPPELPPDSVVLRRLAETYDVTSSSSFAHADNGSMANTVNDATLLFAYRPLKNSNVRLLDAGDHAHHPLGVGFLCVPTTDRGIAGAPTFVFIRTYHTPTIPGIIISHSAMSKQLSASSYHTSSHSTKVGFIHFPHRLRRCQDIYITIQPTSQRGGLTFTEALVLPTAAQHTASLPSSMRVLRLCSDHQAGPTASILDSTDGMSCQACQLPPTSDFR